MARKAFFEGGVGGRRSKNNLDFSTFFGFFPFLFFCASATTQQLPPSLPSSPAPCCRCLFFLSGGGCGGRRQHLFERLQTRESDGKRNKKKKYQFLVKIWPRSNFSGRSNVRTKKKWKMKKSKDWTMRPLRPPCSRRKSWTGSKVCAHLPSSPTPNPKKKFGLCSRDRNRKKKSDQKAEAAGGRRFRLFWRDVPLPHKPQTLVIFFFF